MDGNRVTDDGKSAIVYAADGSGRAGEVAAGCCSDEECETDRDSGETAPDALSPDLIEDVERRLSSVASIDLENSTDATASDRLSSILVAVGGGPHSGAAIDTARELAVERDAWIELFHVVSPDDIESTVDCGRAYLTAATERLGDFDRADDWLVEEQTAAEAVVNQSEYYDAVVVGTPTTGRVGRFVFGSTAERVSENADAPVVVVEADGSTVLTDDE